eukprot:2463951-Heterocapsa_arctica.AAC.1
MHSRTFRESWMKRLLPESRGGAKPEAFSKARCHPPNMHVMRSSDRRSRSRCSPHCAACKM